MQKGKYLIWLAIGPLLVAVVYCFVIVKTDYENKIARHIQIADSLKQQTIRLDKKLYQHDSVLRQYMKSLDQAILVLHEKSARNRVNIASNLSKLDSIQLAYCNEMHKIGVTTLDCN
ncbi:hypothetical protein SanaruYs_02960 [Chryseotalea sanaruensis]|uniref:Uncharacterized protein n=1 Tax=Chryseotalea sanaruensis TaxID=2482724 RepID=A0A401U597_9BACT|nr:hypothetical protein [Chryseotalea sanaruensis]GCC50081.1 hypothetical protein SanaruYs_02960 [Chryseotalea sanaruensis]